MRKTAGSKHRGKGERACSCSCSGLRSRERAKRIAQSEKDSRQWAVGSKSQTTGLQEKRKTAGSKQLAAKTVLSVKRREQETEGNGQPGAGAFLFFGGLANQDSRPDPGGDPRQKRFAREGGRPRGTFGPLNGNVTFLLQRRSDPGGPGQTPFAPGQFFGRREQSPAEPGRSHQVERDNQ